MVLVGCALQVKSLLVVVHNFQHGHVVGVLFSTVKLLLEGLDAVVVDQGELVA